MAWEGGRKKSMWLSFEKGNETRAGLCKSAASRGRNWRGSSLNCLTDLLDLTTKRKAGLGKSKPTCANQC